MIRKIIPLCLVVGLAASACGADWTYDFDGAAPATWTVASVTQPPGGSSASLTGALESGYLRLSDPTLAKDGGSFSAFAGPTGDVFSNVTVAVDLNVAKDTDDDLGVVARADLTTGNGYFAAVDYELGSACITKVQGFSDGADLACSPLGSLGGSDAHHIEFSLVGSDFELLVFDSTGNTLIQTVNASDDGSVLGGAYASGVSGLYMVPKGTTLAEASSNALNGTFDNASSFAVPEPSSTLMVLFGIAGVFGFRRRAR